jgi:hypothetical protein
MTKHFSFRRKGHHALHESTRIKLGTHLGIAILQQFEENTFRPISCSFFSSLATPSPISSSATSHAVIVHHVDSIRFCF